MDLELRHLRTVRAIAETGSLTRAAHQLGLAQPALSTQLQRMERTLGGPLFERDRTGARLTPLGELVLERARVVLPALQGLREEAVRFRNASRSIRRFRIGGTHGPLLGGLVDRLTRAFPGVPVSVHTSWHVSEIAGLALEGRLDFALIGSCGQSPPPADGLLTWRTLGTDPVFVMLAEDHPLARREARTELELAELAGERWGGVPGEGCFAECFAGACARAGFAPASLYESDVSSCVHLVQVRRTVGLCRATFPPTPRLVTRPLAGSPLRWRHLLGWHPDSAAAPVAAAALGQARGAYGDAVSRSSGYAGWLPRHPEFGAAAPDGPS
ncbi:LysR family transcriptional regulator [Streptomyces sp. ACA25]|uniref:LysR family transcriptional regulator n=1 Tax=Streptomyces sp. ACA25 TaxID=3022596 RepID=UPI002306DD3C|nr:LysR family transcriptional regulator [Streptomyces sp. ACA25]MDB1090313.1 LysR family transcriptional regulator [Streptomyces sp. ACA25]